MKKKKYYLLLLIFIVMLTSGCFFNKKNLEGTDEDYTYENTYYVITKNVDSGKISYFEVNGKGNRRKTEQFESDIFDDFIDVDKYTCFYNYHDEERHGFFNKYVDGCKMIRSNGNDVSEDSLYKKIAIQIASLEHDMFDIKIYKIGDEYYVTRGLNVNIYVPYELYKYNVSDNKLELICKIPDEEIIGFKKKNIYDEYDYDVKNAKSIILDDSIEVNGKKLDDKIRLVVYPTKNNNCKDDVKLYSQYENSNVYFVCIGEVEIVYHPNMSHVETINYNSKSNIDYIIRQMNIKEQYRDGGSIMYERESLRILKCNTVDGNKDIYIGYDNLEYKKDYCKGI